jgi:hypothetical protein
MENELILLKHFIEEDNIKAAIDKEKEIELKYKRDENKELYQKSTEIFELLKYLKSKRNICDMVDKILELNV